ncbi:MAG: hypothetical protein ACI9O6_000930 [Glaciecola sp.]|jgi:hypothetical protein
MNASHHLILFLSLVLTLSANASNSMPKMQTPAAIDAKSSENSMSTPDLKNTPLTFEQISKHYIKNPMMVSEARLKVLFWKIYDAKLAAPDGSWKKDTPFALSLSYLRDFEGEEIARRSVGEMREIGYDDEALLSKWYEQMREIFPNVKEGENITGVFDKNQHSHFFYQGKLIGTIEDKVFGQSFFGIWLHEKTSEPDMRKQLLGLK